MQFLSGGRVTSFSFLGCIKNLLLGRFDQPYYVFFSISRISNFHSLIFLSVHAMAQSPNIDDMIMLGEKWEEVCLQGSLLTCTTNHYACCIIDIIPRQSTKPVGNLQPLTLKFFLILVFVAFLPKNFFVCSNPPLVWPPPLADLWLTYRLIYYNLD